MTSVFRRQQCLDGLPLPKLRVSEARAGFGLVSQEPVLFDYSIAENIAYGANDGPPTYQQIVDAAQQANIHNFIVSLPQVFLICVVFGDLLIVFSIVILYVFIAFPLSFTTKNKEKKRRLARCCWLFCVRLQITYTIDSVYTYRLKQKGISLSYRENN